MKNLLFALVTGLFLTIANCSFANDGKVENPPKKDCYYKGKKLTRGNKGGCYYRTKNNKKVYVDRSYCNCK